MEHHRGYGHLFDNKLSEFYHLKRQNFAYGKRDRTQLDGR
jgi:hypothetical protein